MNDSIVPVFGGLSVISREVQKLSEVSGVYKQKTFWCYRKNPVLFTN